MWGGEIGRGIMRSALHQQLRALEKQKAKIESKIGVGSGEQESEALQEVMPRAIHKSA